MCNSYWVSLRARENSLSHSHSFSVNHLLRFRIYTICEQKLSEKWSWEIRLLNDESFSHVRHGFIFLTNVFLVSVWKTPHEGFLWFFWNAFSSRSRNSVRGGHNSWSPHGFLWGRGHYFSRRTAPCPLPLIRYWTFFMMEKFPAHASLLQGPTSRIFWGNFWQNIGSAPSPTGESRIHPSVLIPPSYRCPVIQDVSLWHYVLLTQSNSEI